jgi:dUTP pyrophosphatase
MTFDSSTRPPSCPRPLHQRSFARRVEDLLQAICEERPHGDVIGACTDLGDYNQARIGVLRRAAITYLPDRTHRAIQRILFGTADAAKACLKEWHDINDEALDFIAERRRAMKSREDCLAHKTKPVSPPEQIPAATPPGMFAPDIKVHHPDPAFIPVRATAGAAGFDLRAYLPDSTEAARHPDGVVVPCMTIKAHDTVIVPTGLSIAIPPGFEMQIRPRSGASLKGRFLIPNSPATIDSDWRGVTGVIVHALQDFVIEHGDRIAQAVIAPVALPTLVPVADVADLGTTERGVGGFGSTGVK